MILKDILAISGEPGLFRFIAQGKNAIIVEHLETGRRSSAFSSAKVSSLEDISVFTAEEDIPLGKVFDRIHEKESGGPSIDPKTETSDNLRKYFEVILPEYDREKVYVSDIRKIITWYNLLHKGGLLVVGEAEKTDDPQAEETNDEIKPAPDKKKKKNIAGKAE